MQIQPPQSGPHHSQSARPQTREIAGKFFSVTRNMGSSPDHDKLVAQTQKWVSQTFFGEMLKQMRNSPFKSKIFSGGRGGEAFTEMFDQKLADKIAKGSGHKLVDSIVKKIEAGKAYGNASRLPTNQKTMTPPTPSLINKNVGMA